MSGVREAGDAPIAFEYRSMASLYCLFLNAALPCSLIFSACATLSSDGAGSISSGGEEGD